MNIGLRNKHIAANISPLLIHDIKKTNSSLIHVAAKPPFYQSDNAPEESGKLCIVKLFPAQSHLEIFDRVVCTISAAAAATLMSRTPNMLRLLPVFRADRS